MPLKSGGLVNLDDFADYRISAGDRGYLYLRHQNCPDRFVERIDLPLPLMESNIKWLMMRATMHWQEKHQNETNQV